MIIFLNENKEIFNYADSLLETDTYYIAHADVRIPKSIVYSYEQVDSLPVDFEMGKYMYIDNEFVLIPVEEENISEIKED